MNLSANSITSAHSLSGQRDADANPADAGHLHYHYPAATANPVSEQNGGLNHAKLTRNGYAHTAWLLHRVVFVKRGEAQFSTGLFNACGYS